MPAYDYTCPVCGHKEERIVKMEERDEQVCSRTVREADGPGPYGRALECGAKMERDEIALTARMSDQWRF